MVDSTPDPKAEHENCIPKAEYRLFVAQDQAINDALAADNRAVRARLVEAEARLDEAVRLLRAGLDPTLPPATQGEYQSQLDAFLASFVDGEQPHD